MDEISKQENKELKDIVGYNELSEVPKKRVSIIKDKKQFSIRIPSKFADFMDIDGTKDSFEFCLIRNDGKFGLQGFLIKDEK